MLALQNERARDNPMQLTSKIPITGEEGDQLSLQIVAKFIRVEEKYR